ncbi:MAG: CAP domain-containing protein [Pseudomonadota bacterium]
MNYLSSKFSYLFKASVFVRHLPIQAPLAIVCICFLSTLLSACGGSSGSGAESGSQVTTQDDGNFTQAPPAPSTPDTPEPQTGDNSSYNLGSTPQAVIDQCMSDADKEMLTHVNDVRSQASNCGSENYPATAALSWHCTLDDAAYEHSRDMGDHNFFSHTGSDGLGSADRVKNAGYDWSAVGENIAAGQQTIEAVMTVWLDSPGHCANIMHSSYTEFGAASYTVNGSDFPIYWTQIFARPRI